MSTFDHISFYRFVPITDPQGLRDELYAEAKKLELKGTILIAVEGVNGCMSGEVDKIQSFMAYLLNNPLFENLYFKHSHCVGHTYKKLMIKVKKEIVTFRDESLAPKEKTGKYITPENLDKLYESGEDILIVDTRNDFEYEMGHFKNAINPKLKSFTEWAKFVDEKLIDFKDKKIITYCTGGIRCEKATAYLLKKGFQDVYQVEGGILEYFKARGASNYEGTCFVFDERRAVNSQLEPAPL